MHPYSDPLVAAPMRFPIDSPPCPPCPCQSAVTGSTRTDETPCGRHASERAAGGTRTGETGFTLAQRECEPVKTSLYGSCNPIFQSECEPAKEWGETGVNDSHSSRLHVNQHANDFSPRLTSDLASTRTDKKTSIGGRAIRSAHSGRLVRVETAWEFIPLYDHNQSANDARKNLHKSTEFS